MTLYPAVRNAKRCPSHPGRLLSGLIDNIPNSKTELASLLGISRQHFYDLLNEKKPVSPPVAARLGKMFGDGAAVWLRMQAAHDAWKAERDVDVSKIPTLEIV